MLLATPNQDSNVQTSHQCLAVNAAFLREIKEDNRFLDELLLATRDGLADHPLTAVRLRPLVELLSRLRDRLAMRFSMEVAFGYFDNAIEFPRDQSCEADRYRSQHTALFLELGDIVESAERLLYRESREDVDRAIQRIGYAFFSFYRRLQQHETAENDLIDRVLARRSVEFELKGALMD